MQTQSIQFGRHKTHSHTPSHTHKVGGRFVSSHPKSSGNPDHDALVKQAQKWVSQTFYGEMLKQMRKSPFKDKTLSGGEGGEAFTEMFDQQMADKMSKGAGQKLVDSIVEKIEAKGTGNKPVNSILNKTEANKAYGAPGGKSKMPAGHHVKIKAPTVSPTLQAKMEGRS